MKATVTKPNKELRLRFNLKQVREEDKLTQIFLTATINSQRMRVYTHLRVKPKYWDKKQYRCCLIANLAKRDRMHLQQVNEQIECMEKSLREADLRMAATGKYLHLPLIRQVVEAVRENRQAAQSPVEVMRNLAEEYEQGINRRGQRGIRSTRTTYLTAVARLEAYDRTREQPIRSFEEFNTAFFDQFTAYLYRSTYGKQRKHYTQNTIVNTLKVIKNLLHRAYDSRLLRDDSFLRVQTVLPSNVSEQVYLNEQEIRRFATVETFSRQEREVRDMFVIACHTALRFSDVQRLGEANIKGDLLCLYQQKTRERVEIPIMRAIKPLVAHYLQCGFPRLNKATANKTVRLLAARCHIDETVTRREWRGGELLVVSKPKHAFVSFHTARRSCITNLYLRGYAPNYIMSLSGHHSFQAFQRYVRASGEEIMQQFLCKLKQDKIV